MSCARPTREIKREKRESRERAEREQRESRESRESREYHGREQRAIGGERGQIAISGLASESVERGERGSLSDNHTTLDGETHVCNS